jgi:hypothetical protein
MVAPMSSPAGRADAAGSCATGSLPLREAPRKEPARDLIAVAEALGIPWERLLEGEIQAERTLRGYVGEPEPDVPLWRFVSALPATALNSWRVRERLEARIREARLTGSGAAVRCVREAVDELCGKRGGGDSDRRALALHLALALERVRELARVARAAEKSRGDRGERLNRIFAKTGCTEADAAWALERLESSDRTHSIDDAVRRAREEGFEIPVEESEFHSFLALRRLARRTPAARRRRASSGSRPGAGPHPHRLAS